MKRDHKKPTGEIGAVSFGPTSEAVTFSPIPFPTRKEDIERFIAMPFAMNASIKGWFPFKLLAPPEQNSTDDLDFTLHTDAGPKYLELMEIHLADIGLNIPSGQFVYEPYAVAERILGHIQNKSNRYQGATSRGIILLTYVTHWQFCLDNVVYWLLAYWMRERPLIFEQVFHLDLLDETAFESYPLYPSDKDFSGFEPEKFRENRTFLLNPRRWQLERR
jgi:hypothetical protein